MVVPMSRWQVIHTGVARGHHHMEWDRQALDTLEPDAPCLLHLYEWAMPTISYGYFLRPEELFSFQGVEKHGIDLVRRPTGGGAVLHPWDMAFSVLVPAPYCRENTLDNYQQINRAVLAAVCELLGFSSEDFILKGKEELSRAASFCMAKPTVYDVIFQRKKIAGAAQRRTKKGLLHQGFVTLKRPCKETLKELLLGDQAMIDAICEHAYPLIAEGENSQEIKERLSHHLKRNLEKQYEEF
jgi:lipoate-protein ligase A